MDERLVAWSGTVEILNATWSLDSGRTVELRLCGDAYDRLHPFKRFQKKRNGRVGTRFHSAFSRMDSGQEVLAMEVMLAAWKDSSSVGQSITLWLDDEVETHPFCGCTRRKANVTGDMFALVLVELADDDTPINQPEPQSAGAGEGIAGAATEGTQVPEAPDGDPVHPGRGGSAVRNQAAPKGRTARKFSASVHLLVTGVRYVQWLQETKGTLVKEWTPELARRYTKQVLEVESLSDLDRDQNAVNRFHELIRRPFARWNKQEP